MQPTPSTPYHALKKTFLAAGLVLAAGSATAQYSPIPLTQASYNQDIVVEHTAPHIPSQPTTASMDNGTNNTGDGWYEVGFDTAAPTTGVPVAGSTFASASFSNHSYTMAPNYATNDVVFIDASVTSGNITFNSPVACTALSFLTSSGNGAVTINYTAQHADGTSETGSFSTQDWFSGGGQAVTVNGRLDVQSLAVNSVNSGDPKIYTADVTLTDTTSAVTNLVLTYSSGGGHACIFAVSGSTGGNFNPIGISGYNEDMIVEATPALNGHYTTVSMDAGTGNNGNAWYEQGFDGQATNTGLPVAGSTVEDLSASSSYTFAPSYAANDVAYLDGSHNATLVPITPGFYSGLSFLGSAGHGPITVDYTVFHADGTSETGNFSVPDWFSSSLTAYIPNGRVDVNSGQFANVNSSNPKLFEMDISLINPNSQVTAIQLTYDSGNTSGGIAAIFAVSGQGSGASPTAPFNLTISPVAQTQYLGSRAYMTATASGTLPFSYQWNSNGVPILNATNFTLELTGLTAGDAAAYSCTVTNIAGSAATGNSTLTVSALPTGAPGVVLNDEPLVYYRLNEGAVTPETATNQGSLGAAGNGAYFPGCTHQVPGAIAGDPDTACGYTGIDTNSDDGAVPTIVPYNPALNPNGSFTVEAWLNPSEEGNLGNAQAPFNNQFNDTNGNRVGWDFFQRAAATQTPDANGPGYSFRMFNGTAGSESQTTVFNITGGNYVVGQWAHLVAVYDATVPSATLYLNGQQVAQSTSPNGTYAANTNSPFSIGGYPDASENPFIGAIDEVAIYTNALSATQVLNHYETGTNVLRTLSYPATITGDGAVEYLRLDEPEQNPAANIGVLGPALNGTYTGTQNGVPGPQPPANTGFAATNTAAAFNQTNSYIELENPPGLNFDGPITLEAWIQPAASQNFESYIIGHGGNDTYSSEVNLRIENGTYQVGSVHGKASYPIPAGDLGGGQWVHLVGTWDGANWNLYRNSVLVATGADSYGPSTVSNANWAIGARGRWKYETGLVDPGQDTRIFNGAIDEAAIYDHALTQPQIQAHYFMGRYDTTNAPATILVQPVSLTRYAGGTATFSVTAGGATPLDYQWYKNSSVISGATNPVLTLTDVQTGSAGNYSVTVTNALGMTNSQAAVLTVLGGGYGAVISGDSPVAFWPLDETNGTTAYDIFSGAYNGTYVNGPTQGVAGATGNTGTAVDFDGSSQYVDLGNPSGLNLTGQITFEAWIYPEATSGDRDIFGRGDSFSPVTGEIFLRIENGTYEVGAWNGNNTYDASFAMPPGDLNTWVYIAGTYDGTQWNLYRDGVLENSGGTGLAPMNLEVSWAIADGTASGNNRNFQGAIQDAAIYGYALSSSRISAHYQAGISVSSGLAISLTGSAPVITWQSGTLESSTNVAGPYVTVTNATSPYTPPAGLTQQFFRVAN